MQRTCNRYHSCREFSFNPHLYQQIILLFTDIEAYVTNICHDNCVIYLLTNPFSLCRIKDIKKLLHLIACFCFRNNLLLSKFYHSSLGSIAVEYRAMLYYGKDLFDIMKEIRLHEGELNVMELLWSNKELAAKDISKIIKEYIGWEKNTTYTVIKRLIDKGAVEREDPGFICRAKVSKRKIQEIETKALIDQLYNGSISSFILDYINNQRLTGTDIENLERVVSNHRRL